MKYCKTLMPPIAMTTPRQEYGPVAKRHATRAQASQLTLVVTRTTNPPSQPPHPERPQVHAYATKLAHSHLRHHAQMRHHEKMREAYGSAVAMPLNVMKEYGQWHCIPLSLQPPVLESFTRSFPEPHSASFRSVSPPHLHISVCSHC